MDIFLFSLKNNNINSVIKEWGVFKTSVLLLYRIGRNMYYIFFMNVIALKCTHQQICIIVNENLFDLLSCVPLVNSDISFVRACAW